MVSSYFPTHWFDSAFFESFSMSVILACKCVFLVFLKTRPWGKLVFLIIDLNGKI